MSQAEERADAAREAEQAAAASGRQAELEHQLALTLDKLQRRELNIQELEERVHRLLEEIDLLSVRLAEEKAQN